MYFYRIKIVDFSKIQTRIAEVDGEQADPLDHHQGPQQNLCLCLHELSWMKETKGKVVAFEERFSLEQ